MTVLGLVSAVRSRKRRNSGGEGGFCAALILKAPSKGSKIFPVLLGNLPAATGSRYGSRPGFGSKPEICRELPRNWLCSFAWASGLVGDQERGTYRRRLSCS